MIEKVYFKKVLELMRKWNSDSEGLTNSEMLELEENLKETLEEIKLIRELIREDRNSI